MWPVLLLRGMTTWPFCRAQRSTTCATDLPGWRAATAWWCGVGSSGDGQGGVSRVALSVQPRYMAVPQATHSPPPTHLQQAGVEDRVDRRG
jgi:hypothetical protein